MLDRGARGRRNGTWLMLGGRTSFALWAARGQQGACLSRWKELLAAAGGGTPLCQRSSSKTLSQLIAGQQ